MNKETILKHHDKCTTFVFAVDDFISSEEMFLLQKANGMVLAYMNVRNIHCFTLKENVLKFIIGGDCTEHEDVLERNVSFGLTFMGVSSSYLGWVVDVS
jgi:hypothetical protein